MSSVSRCRQREEFQSHVWRMYAAYGRDLPWRSDIRPYPVLVSEIMLQQTQVSRVVPKFQGFLHQFPDIQSLADTPQAAVMQAWQGLGYNRRARFLHQTAKTVCQQYSGRIPDSRDELTRLPGIGVNTAGSIAVFAYNQPVVFVETNIRSVFLHWFFGDREDVSDKEIFPVIEATLDQTDPRQWYWALMDYGARIKQTRPNPSRQSRHYTRQSPFSGSKREIRGEVIRILTESAHSYEQLALRVTDTRLPDVLADLESEHLIVQTGSNYALSY